MAGHSKWANIQHRKGAQDKKRAKVFTRLIREVTVAARIGGGSDPETNPRLRLAIDRARAANMPNDTINRAAKRGAGELEGVTLESILYEGYGPSGVAVMVECLTDNRNRTVAEVRHAFSKSGGSLSTSGSVSYLFNKQGVISFASGADADLLMEVALEAGADDIQQDDDGMSNIVTTPDSFDQVLAALEAKGLTPEQAQVDQVASTEVSLDKEGAEKMIRLLDMLEELDDVSQVYSNADISEDILNQLA